jgi:acyl-coenzyme A synthetase/AMP-(fatty) acid ligase
MIQELLVVGAPCMSRWDPQRVGYAGEPIDTATMAQLRKRLCANVVNTYGTMETGSWGGDHQRPFRCASDLGAAGARAQHL